MAAWLLSALCVTPSATEGGLSSEPSRWPHCPVQVLPRGRPCLHSEGGNGMTSPFLHRVWHRGLALTPKWPMSWDTGWEQRPPQPGPRGAGATQPECFRKRLSLRNAITFKNDPSSQRWPRRPSLRGGETRCPLCRQFSASGCSPGAAPPSPRGPRWLRQAGGCFTAGRTMAKAAGSLCPSCTGRKRGPEAGSACPRSDSGTGTQAAGRPGMAFLPWGQGYAVGPSWLTGSKHFLG